jgi:hypothetical protein
MKNTGEAATVQQMIFLSRGIFARYMEVISYVPVRETLSPAGKGAGFR